MCWTLLDRMGPHTKQNVNEMEGSGLISLAGGPHLTPSCTSCTVVKNVERRCGAPHMGTGRSDEMKCKRKKEF